MKIKIDLLFSIRSAIRNTRFESGRRASYITCIRCKSSLSYSRANQGVLDVPILSHLSLYTSSFSLLSSPLLFHFVIPVSLFQRASSMRLARWNFSTLFSPILCTDIKFHRSRFCPCALYFTCTLVPSRLSSNCPLSRIYTVYSESSLRMSYPKREKIM